MDEDIWYDMYNEDVEFDAYDDVDDAWEDDQSFDSPSLFQMLNDCVLPTLNDVTLPIAKVLLGCAIMRLTNVIGVPNFTRHLVSICIGSWLAFQFFKQASLYLIVFTIAAYIILKFSNSWFSRKCGSCLAVFSVVYSVFCELVMSDEKLWHTVRGANMIIVMKVVSVAFDLDHQSKSTMPPLLQFISFCFSPSTIIFGPWISYSDFLKMMTQKNTDNMFWIAKLVKCLVLSLSFLSISTCWSHWLFGFSESTVYVSLVTKWMLAYGDALSYRCSHYFVSYLSECLTTTVGIHHDLKVAQPYHVELPRSLVEVVIHWNLPMHNWLKTYVFKVARRHGVFVAIFATYAVSSLLHGLNFQLAAVLLSLGSHTYVEYEFRRKMSEIFSACIMARKCKSSCRHQYKEDHRWVIAANIFFSVMALFHLTYLGLMFDSNPSVEEKGYDMRHTLSKWGELGYASHWLNLFVYVFNLLL
ncbi:hypothetical protein CHUAL_004920 [Chamberlinius hualienensis]